ncbi:MAG TPA: nodulation protein NfeD [Acidobacteriota bacterium]|nr:nodulation protein NfeD [Acidobacteriota bacterium]
MRTRRGVLSQTLAVALLLVVAAPAAAQAPERQPLVVVANLADTIHAITSEYVVEALESASEQDADLFLLRIDTPGGLDLSMRDIIQAFRASDVPVCLFVGPSGARAASAGFFMAMAADVVVMAPGTNMGAASPVSVGGGTDETMQRKLIHDAEAYMRSLAEDRGRPVDLAVEAVTDGRSYSAQEALQSGLADFIVDDVEALLDVVSGTQISKGGTDTVLQLADARIESHELSLRQRVLAIVANPQVAYILMLAGLAGLYFEFSTPGAVLPGVLGGICLVLALQAFQVLPISFAGLLLIALALLFFILEVKVTSYGLLTVAGVVAFVLGSLMLVPGPIPELRLQLGFVLPAALGILGITGSLVWLVVRSHRGRVQTGPKGLVTQIGHATSDLRPGEPGSAFVHGELWRARSDVPVRSGDAVEVVGVESGMVIRVRPSQAYER